MARLYVGQRVRIKWSNNWPELACQEGTIIEPSPSKGILGDSEWRVAPDCWGSFIAPIAGIVSRGKYFAPNSSQLEPITDSYDLVSWESMRDLWVPEHLREDA